MRFIVLFACITISIALQLEEVKVAKLIGYDVTFQKHDCHEAEKLSNDISVKLNKDDIAEKKFFDTIASEIMLALDTNCNADIYHKEWKLTVTQKTGSLKVIEVKATIAQDTVKITGGIVDVSVPVPTVYNVEQSCERGNRKYGVAGPRKNHCHNYNVERGLNGDEILEIQNALLNKIPDASKLLN